MHEDLASQQYSPLITLMTADYLLTARDLPGWPGKFEMFTYKSLIEKTFKFLINSTFSNEVLVREMKILREISKQHEELDYFNYMLKNTKRKSGLKDVIDGFFITSNVFIFNGEQVGIKNIYDAALATPFAYELCNKVSFRSVVSYVKRFVRVALNTCSYKKIIFPSIN